VWLLQADQEPPKLSPYVRNEGANLAGKIVNTIRSY